MQNETTTQTEATKPMTISELPSPSSLNPVVIVAIISTLVAIPLIFAIDLGFTLYYKHETILLFGSDAESVMSFTGLPGSDLSKDEIVALQGLANEKLVNLRWWSVTEGNKLEGAKAAEDEALKHLQALRSSGDSREFGGTSVESAKNYLLAIKAAENDLANARKMREHSEGLLAWSREEYHDAVVAAKILGFSVPNETSK